ncbi:MAG TPA: dephospho-CoA kinase [Dehalococcoidia bacterium]|jgi:dephospho-CoA kinase|nr:dephospho-CoA kinase [Dehalococcoidia bacterium]
MKNKTIILGITGSIATGKSTIINKLLKEFNPEYCDADKLVHTLYEPGKPAYHRIIEIFGKDLIDNKTKYIDRQKLGGIVFKDKNSMKKLTDAIGNIGIEVKNIVDSWIADNKKIGIVEAVNLIEANYIVWCDEVWLFKVDDTIALERLKNRNNLSQNEAKKRIKSQVSWNKRVDYANFTIDTDGDINDIYIKIKKLYIDLIKN